MSRAVLRELRRPLMAYNIGLVLLISFLDFATRPGIIVGILLCVPIVASSLLPRLRHVLAIAGLATVSFVLIFVFSPGPLFPREVWLPNRILVLFSLVATTLLALWLQRIRRSVERARDEAVRTGRLNELLLSLLAHDLRSPLALTGSALDYVLSRPPDQLDRRLITDVAGRIRRSLLTVDRLLAVGGPMVPAGEHTDARLTPTLLLRELEEETMSEQADAERRGKRIVVESGVAERIVPDAPLDVDPLAARHALGILVDNAVRHAVPGRIHVRLRVEPRWLIAEVEDEGPGLGNADPAGAGAGVGLRLCRSLAELLGGGLHLERSRPDGTLFRLRLPARVTRSHGAQP